MSDTVRGIVCGTCGKDPREPVEHGGCVCGSIAFAAFRGARRPAFNSLRSALLAGTSQSFPVQA